MPSIVRRLKQRLCRHGGKRVWDVHRLPDGRFRLRIYCPACGWREDVVRAPEEVIQRAAGDNPDMTETMRRNLNRGRDPDRDA